MIYNAYVEIISNNENQLQMPIGSPSNDAIQEVFTLKEIAVKLCALVNSKKKSNNDELKNQIIEYIQKNYSNKGLNANEIAEYFSLSEKYIFLLIKESTGNSLGKYIEDIRLTEAEKYLMNTNFSNKEISEKVGFGSEITFYRSFSKKYNKTPSIFRKLHNDNTI